VNEATIISTPDMTAKKKIAPDDYYELQKQIISRI